MSGSSDIHAPALKLPPRSRLELAGDLLHNLPDASDPVDILTELQNRESQLENRSMQLMSEAEFWKGAITTRHPG